MVPFFAKIHQKWKCFETKNSHLMKMEHACDSNDDDEDDDDDDIDDKPFV